MQNKDVDNKNYRSDLWSCIFLMRKRRKQIWVIYPIHMLLCGLKKKKKISKKSKKRKRLSQNLPLIQFLFKWKVAAFSLGKIHYTFDKLQEKAFHEEPLKKNYLAPQQSLIPTHQGCSTAPKVHEQTSGLQWATRLHKAKLGTQRWQWKTAESLLYHLRVVFLWWATDINRAHQALPVILNPLQRRELPQLYFLWSSTSHPPWCFQVEMPP